MPDSYIHMVFDTLAWLAAAVIFAGMGFSGGGSGADQFILLWVICLAVSFGGIMLIVKAFR